MNKTLSYYSIIISSFLMAFIFATATTYIQLGVAVALFPVFSFLILKILPRKHKNTHNNVSATPQMAATPQVAPVMQQQTQAKLDYNEEVQDIDKRAFLKIIGATSVSLLITSLFARRADSLLFGGNSSNGQLALQDTKGKIVDPVERQPTDGYQITEIDDSETSYFGFTNKEGGWFIMRQDTETGSFRYTKGNMNFSANWRDRDTLDYYYFHEVFK